MHVSWFQQLKFCQLVESFCLCKLAAYRMNEELLLKLSWPHCQDNSVRYEYGVIRAGAKWCQCSRKRGLCVLQLVTENFDPDRRAKRWKWFEKCLNFRSRWPWEATSCQWGVYQRWDLLCSMTDIFRYYTFASFCILFSKKPHTGDTPSQTWIWRFATTTASLVRIPNAWLMTWARTGDDWFVFDDCAFEVS